MSKEIIVALVSALGGALTSFFAFKGKKAEADSPIESVYVKEMQEIIREYKSQKEALQQEANELKQLVEQVKLRNSDLELENKRLKSEVEEFKKEIKELRKEINQLKGLGKYG